MPERSRLQPAAIQIDRVTTPGSSEQTASFSSPGLLALEGGVVLAGSLHGAPLPAEGELVFTTAATGWGEILTDPSYAGQIVVLTHPMAGNYRIADDEHDVANRRAERMQREQVRERGRSPQEGPGRGGGGHRRRF